METTTYSIMGYILGLYRGYLGKLPNRTASCRSQPTKLTWRCRVLITCTSNPIVIPVGPVLGLYRLLIRGF